MFNFRKKKDKNVIEEELVDVSGEDIDNLNISTYDDKTLTSMDIEKELRIPEEYSSKCIIMVAENVDEIDGNRFIATLAIDETVKNNPEYISLIRKRKLEALKRFDLNITVKPYTLEEITEMSEDASFASQKEVMITNTRIQKMARELFVQASKAKASDIHIRVENKIARVRFRVHGLLREHTQWDSNEGEMFVKTVYSTMASDTDAYFQDNKSQNGRINDSQYLPSNVDALRMATTSHTEGVYAVFRLLYKQENMEDKDVDSLGYSNEQIEQISKMKQKPTGLNLIVGSTGSGKSTTLQIVLSKIIKDSKGQKNIITVEDPPEYPIFGATQTAVANAEDEDDRKVKFNEKITAAMRLDPDIIMLGEIRDGASASLGIRAAMTGHQVWSTLHANGIFGAIDRLMDYDVSLDMLSDPQILTGIIYQKLVPVLCEGCKKPAHDVDMGRADIANLERLLHVAEGEGLVTKDDLDNKNISAIFDKVFYRGDGCNKCKGGPHGIIGRTVSAEILYPDEKILELIRKKEKEKAKEYWKNELKGRDVQYRAGAISLSGTVDPIMAEDAVGFFISKF